MAEGQEPHVADEQVEGAGEQREAQRLHEEERVDEEGRQHEEGDHQREGHVLVPRLAPDAAGSALASRSPSPCYCARPKRPAGFTSSTSAMMTKITVFDASG